MSAVEVVLVSLICHAVLFLLLRWLVKAIDASVPVEPFLPRIDYPPMWRSGPCCRCDAAPELLAALEEIYEWTAYKDTAWAKRAKAAIDKAKGVQS